jgi:hypothetical protein
VFVQFRQQSQIIAWNYFHIETRFSVKSNPIWLSFSWLWISRLPVVSWCLSSISHRGHIAIFLSPSECMNVAHLS